ncbi:alpha/beta fold hydrolase [Limnohabitans sp.]|uniref:alpha/beta fold hydrolase n=1 Tax=Limnohabitans sp. TaxID=1907725 RepID=UPI002FDDDB81
MTQPLLVFSHGNSFPACTYRVMLDAVRARGFRVEAVDKFGHDPRYPVTDNWPHLVQQLSDFAAPLAAQNGPVFLVGHSLGGILSMMVAAKHPELVSGVVLLDAPMLGGWKARLLQVGKRVPGAQAFSPAAISRKRRTTWANEAEVLAHFQSKKLFAKWHPQVLQDYVQHGTHDEPTEQGTRRVLSFDRDVESAIYNGLPDHLETYFKRHPLTCKAALIGGLQSRELKQVGLDFSRRVTQGRVMKIDGTHLFPMEHPLVAAAAVETALLNLMG